MAFDRLEKFRQLRTPLLVPIHDSNIKLNAKKVDQFPTWAVEYAGGYRESWSEDGSANQTERTFVIPWTKRAEFRDYMIGYAWVEKSVLHNMVRIGADGFVKRVIPAQDPEYPYLYASKCELIEGAGKAVRGRFFTKREVDGTPPAPDVGFHAQFGGVPPKLLPEARRDEPDEKNSLRDKITYVGDEENRPANEPKVGEGKAVMRVVYTPRTYRIFDDDEVRLMMEQQGIHTSLWRYSHEMVRWVTRTRTFSYQMLPLAALQASAKNKLTFTEGPYVGAVVPEPGVITVPVVTFLYEWITPGICNAAMNVQGKVNQQIFDGFDGAPLFPRRTLLCQTPTVERLPPGPRGHAMYRITYRFDYKANTWWSFPAKDGQFYTATFGGEDPNLPLTRSIYAEATFGFLFYPEYAPPLNM